MHIFFFVYGWSVYIDTLVNWHHQKFQFLCVLEQPRFICVVDSLDCLRLIHLLDLLQISHFFRHVFPLVWLDLFPWFLLSRVNLHNFFASILNWCPLVFRLSEGLMDLIRLTTIMITSSWFFDHLAFWGGTWKTFSQVGFLCLQILFALSIVSNAFLYFHPEFCPV